MYVRGDWFNYSGTFLKGAGVDMGAGPGMQRGHLWFPVVCGSVPFIEWRIGEY